MQLILRSASIACALFVSLLNPRIAENSIPLQQVKYRRRLR
ncbi:hypothetical protein PSAC2689_20155 [Paraburkholderia sacchari]